MKNKGVANAADAVAVVHLNHTSPNVNELVLEYKNHPAYVPFMSSLRTLHQIKYDGCLQKYLKHTCNTH